MSSFANSNVFAKIKEKSVKAVNSPQVNKERTFHISLFRKAFASLIRSIFYNKASDSALFLIYSYFILNLFLIFHQILGSCSYKINLLKRA